MRSRSGGLRGKSYSEYRLRPARKIELPPAYKEKPKEKVAQPLFNAA